MFYLYRHIRLDKNEPFYVGIGRFRKNYTRYDRAFSENPRSNAWKHVAGKTEYRVDIVFECEDEEQIKEKEIEFIKLYGRVDKKEGTLFNFTEGGDTRTMSDSQKESLRKRMVGNTLMVGRTLSEATKLKMSLSQKGKTRSPKAIETLRLRSIGNSYGTKNKGKRHTEAQKLKWSLDRSTNPTGLKPVICLTTGDSYESIKECATKMFLGTKGNMQCIGLVCNGRAKHYKKYKFSFT